MCWCTESNATNPGLFWCTVLKNIRQNYLKGSILKFHDIDDDKDDDDDDDDNDDADDDDYNDKDRIDFGQILF